MATRVSRRPRSIHPLLDHEAQRAKVAQVLLHRGECQRAGVGDNGSQISATAATAAEAAAASQPRRARDTTRAQAVAVPSALRACAAHRSTAASSTLTRGEFFESLIETCSSELLLLVHRFERLARAMHTDTDVVFRNAERPADFAG